MRRILSLVAMVAMGRMAWAQEQVTSPGPEGGTTSAKVETWHVDLNPYGSYTFDANLPHSGVSMAVTRAGMNASGRIPLSAQWTLDLNLGAEYSNYRFDFGAGTTSWDVMDIQLAPGMEYKLNEHWSFFGGVIGEVAGDAGADVDEASTYGGYVGFKHKVSDQFSYTIGVGGKTMLEDDPTFFPIIGVEWKISEALSFTTSGSSHGADVRLSQAISHHASVSVVVGYEAREYRLGDGAIHDEVFQDTRMPVGLELAWRPNETFALRGTAGYVVWQELEFDDSHGNQLLKSHPEPAPYVGISGVWNF